MKDFESAPSHRKFSTWFAGAITLGIAGALVLCTWLFLDSDHPPLPTATMRVLDNADQFVLYSLNPLSIEYLKPTDERPKEVFHDFPVLGKIEIRDSVARTELLRVLYKGIAESDGMPANCFNPRHGIRAILNGEAVDLVICFECSQIQIHTTDRKGAYTSASAQPTFDQELQKAGVPLAEK